jgi:hypothetical protein
LGLQNQPFLPAGRWQAQVSYQYGQAHNWYIVDQRDDSKAPGGQPPVRTLNIWALDVLYGVSNRVTLDLTVPFLSGSGGFYDPNFSGEFFGFSEGGVGDIALQAEYWLTDPAIPSRISGSVSVGIKAPTGADARQGTYANGAVVPIDETFQMGNGGWELLFRAQGQAPISGPFSAYASGYYGLSLTEHIDVMHHAPSGAPVALRGVPDTYSGRLGAAYLLPVLEGLVLTAGGRINGATTKDVIGGADLYWRRPGYEVYVEPGISWTGPRNIASFSFPVGVYRRKIDSPLDESQGVQRGAGFVPFLVIASYAHRF